LEGGNIEIIKNEERTIADKQRIKVSLTRSLRNYPWEDKTDIEPRLNIHFGIKSVQYL